MPVPSVTTHTLTAPLPPRFLAAWTALEAKAARVPVPAALATLACPEGALRLAVARVEDQLVGVWPFRIARVGPVRAATRPGGSVQVYDGPTLACDVRDDLVTAALWREVKSWSDVDLVHLPAFLPESPIRTIPEVDQNRIPHGRTARVALHTLACADDLVARQPKHRRKSIRRRRRALERRGAVVFHTATEANARVELVRWALDTKVAWLDAQAALGATVRSAGFRTLLDQLARQPAGLVVHSLQVGGQVAAVELGFVDGPAYHSFLGTYDPALAKEGAGVALTLEVIGWCKSRQIALYDLLAPLTDFKTTWSDHQRVVSAAVVPTSVVGHLAAPLFRDARDRVKQLGARMPRPVRDPLLTVLERSRPKTLS